MDMNKLFVIFCLLFILCVNTFCHSKLVHRYLTFQAWELVKNQHPNVLYTTMNTHMGGNWGPEPVDCGNTVPWTIANVLVGVTREDCEDVVWKHWDPWGGNVTSTHFWDVESCQSSNSGNDCLTYILGYGYANSYMKNLCYWYGNVNGNGFIEVGYYLGVYGYFLKLKYNYLPNVYKHDEIWVTARQQVGEYPWVTLEQPVLLKDFLLPYGYSYTQIRARIEKICWEVVGRMCHLIEDAGVPAHAHGDTHVGGDWYETYYIAEPNNHYLDYNMNTAIAQAQQFNQNPIIEIDGKADPIRFALYTTNQVADRFPSNDADGDLDFQNSYTNNQGTDNYQTILQPIYNSITASHVRPYDATLLPIIGNNAFNYTIRSVAGFLWYIYHQFNIPQGAPPQITNIVRDKPNDKLFWNERLRYTPTVTGTQPIQYAWEWRKCGSYNSGCQNAVPFPNTINFTGGTVGDFFNSFGYNCTNPQNCYQTAQCTNTGQYAVTSIL